jgi:hypothetical protein
MKRFIEINDNNEYEDDLHMEDSIICWNENKDRLRQAQMYRYKKGAFSEEKKETASRECKMADETAQEDDEKEQQDQDQLRQQEKRAGQDDQDTDDEVEDRGGPSIQTNEEENKKNEENSTVHQLLVHTDKNDEEFEEGSSFFGKKLTFESDLEGSVYKNSSDKESDTEEKPFDLAEADDLDDEGCLHVSFRMGSARNTALRYAWSLRSILDGTNSMYYCKIRGDLSREQDYIIPKLPKKEESGQRVYKNIKTLITTHQVFQWFKNKHFGGLCVHCFLNEAQSFIEHMMDRLQSAGFEETWLELEPAPVTNPNASMIWLKIPVGCLKKLALDVYVCASQDVFIVDCDEVLVLRGAMPFTFNLQPPDNQNYKA